MKIIQCTQRIKYSLYIHNNIIKFRVLKKVLIGNFILHSLCFLLLLFLLYFSRNSFFIIREMRIDIKLPFAWKLSGYTQLLPLVMEMHVLATHLKLLAIETLHFHQCFEFTWRLFQSIRTQRIRDPLLVAIAIESVLGFLKNTRFLLYVDFGPRGLEASTFVK